MRNLLGSLQLLNKFKINLDKIIDDYTKSIGLRRQIIDNTYVIRFNKDYTFHTSSENAVKTAIELLNRITKMNAKLTKRKNAFVRCNMFLLKRDINSNPNDYQSGFNISLLYQEAKKKEDKILNTFQVLADAEVMNSLERDYKFEPLNSVMKDGEMEMFYELDLKDKVVVEFEPEEEEEDEIEIPNFVQNMLVEQDKLDGIALNQIDFPDDPDAIYDIETINFNEILCDFIRTENIDVFYHVLSKMQGVPKGIISVKTAELYKPYSLKIINTVENLKIYNNIISITCYDEMKYTPYAFFRDLIAAIFEYTVSQKLFSKNDFSMFASVDPEGMIKDLITLTEREVENPEDTRYIYFDIFFTLLQAIPKTLIFIENFEKIDSSSYDVLKYIFEAFENLDISFLIMHDKEFSLHKQSHLLLSKPYYTEINLKPTPFEKMIEENKYYYRNILDSFYFHRIAKYSCGSILFIDIAIQYLIESGVYAANEDSIDMVNPKTIIIPSNLNKLVKRRLDLLQDNKDAMKFLASILLLGTRIDVETIQSLGYSNLNGIIEKLTNMGYIYFYNNCVYFPNYNLLRDNLLESISPIYLKEIAQELFEKVFKSSMPSPVKAYLYELLNDFDGERNEWEALAQINLSMGDFSAYLNCTNKILQILDKIVDESAIPTIEEYKLQLYENISTNLYEYVPDKTSDIAEITLNNLERNMDVDKIIMLCNKMIQGCLVAGNYSYALELTHKVLSLLPPSSLDPNASDYNPYFFLMSLVHIQILFNVGALNECLEIGYKVLNVVNDNTLEKLKPDYFTNEQFMEMLVDAVGFVAMANVLLLGGNVQEFLKITGADFSAVPQSYNLFIALQDLIHGVNPSIQKKPVSESDKFAEYIYHIINAFTSCRGNYTAFAEEIYLSKISAKNYGLHQLELFADLLIGYAYMNLESYKKADDIFFKLIKATNENGMRSLLYVAWYMMSELSLRECKYDMAFGIVNNSLIQLEKNNTTSEYLIMLFKYNMYKILMNTGEIEKAEICINQAMYIAGKYGIKFVFNTELPNYVKIEETETDTIISEPPAQQGNNIEPEEEQEPVKNDFENISLEDFIGSEE